MPLTKPLKPTRPYTDYNIFFQLEREYILQVVLQVKPEYEPSDLFYVEDESYQGPPLPPKYNGLLLLNDWYIPGKERRRKRRHRKSHGKIGFHELSNRIAQAWSMVDEETRNYCACVSDLGMLQYKSDMRKYKMTLAGRVISNAGYYENKLAENMAISNQSVAFQHRRSSTSTACSTSTDIQHRRSSTSTTSSAGFNQDSTCYNGNESNEDVDLYLSILQTRVLSLEPAKTFESFVDMSDDEIMGIWNSTQEEKDQPEKKNKPESVQSFSQAEMSRIEFQSRSKAEAIADSIASRGPFLKDRVGMFELAARQA